MNNQEALYRLLLRLGDDNLIHAQRLAEWCSRGPILEEDLALINVSLDLFGQSESFLEYAAELKGSGNDADALAFGRSEREYYNHLLCELPNGDFAMTMVKMLFISAYQRELYLSLVNSADERIAAIATKALKEVRYHFRHASDWIIRLGRGTEQSHEKTTFALNELTPYTANLFDVDVVNAILTSNKVLSDSQEIQQAWKKSIQAVMDHAGLVLPEPEHMFTGGINGYHTEHLGHLLCEMQYLHYAHPDAKW